MDGITPGKGGVEEKAALKLPDHIPRRAVFAIRTADDVDNMPRGAIAHLVAWDDDLAFDLMVAGASITLVDRPTMESLANHDDFDPDGFGVIDEAGLWLPGLQFPYTPDADGWVKPEEPVDTAETE
jgi:hypothetical protein